MAHSNGWKSVNELLPRRDKVAIDFSVNVLIRFEDNNYATDYGVGYVEYDSGNWFICGKDDEHVNRVYYWTYFNTPDEIMQNVRIDGE